MLRGIALLVLFMNALFAQDRVSPEMMYYRVWAVVPLIGSGTPDDPKRPMFTPSPAEQAAQLATQVKDGKRSGVLGYSMQLSDDGKTALVEFLGLTPADLKPILNSRVSGVKAFERGQKAEIESEFRKYKAGFTLSTLGGKAQ